MGLLAAEPALKGPVHLHEGLVEDGGEGGLPVPYRVNRNRLIRVSCSKTC